MAGSCAPAGGNRAAARSGGMDVSLACPECGYDRSGDAAARCPECGTLRRPSEGPRELNAFLLFLLICIGVWWLSYWCLVLRVYAEGVGPDPLEKRLYVGFAATVGVGSAGLFLAWRRARWVMGWAWWVKGLVALSLLLLTLAMLAVASAGFGQARA